MTTILRPYIVHDAVGPEHGIAEGAARDERHVGFPLAQVLHESTTVHHPGVQAGSVGRSVREADGVHRPATKGRHRREEEGGDEQQGEGLPIHGRSPLWPLLM